MDTAAELLGSKDAESEVVVTNPETAKGVYLDFPGYMWKDNSCWLDSSLQLIFVTIMGDFPTFHSRLQGVHESVVLHELFVSMNMRRLLEVGDVDARAATINSLTLQRDTFRTHLAAHGFLNRNSTTSYEPATAGFLSSSNAPNAELDIF